MVILSRAVRYHQYGDPRKVRVSLIFIKVLFFQVLQLDQIPVRTDLQSSEVLVKWLASPVDPLDINLVEGSYAIRNQLPAIAGAEGVGRVEKIGHNVRSLRVGDHVLSLASSLWTEYGVSEERNLIRIRNEVDLVRNLLN
jgi:trans-2-enoyl-CoA reductase